MVGLASKAFRPEAGRKKSLQQKTLQVFLWHLQSGIFLGMYFVFWIIVYKGPFSVYRFPFHFPWSFPFDSPLLELISLYIPSSMPALS